MIYEMCILMKLQPVVFHRSSESELMNFADSSLFASI